MKIQDNDDFKGKRILLAEDNELNTEIAEIILRKAGFKVEVAENGMVACDMLYQNQMGYYDLILMDIQMPVMDGYEAARKIRLCDKKELACIPIIAMTADSCEEDREKSYSVGMNGHIAKPIDIKELFDELNKVLN